MFICKLLTTASSIVLLTFIATNKYNVGTLRPGESVWKMGDYKKGYDEQL